MGELRLMEPLKGYDEVSSEYGKRTDPNTGEEEVQHGGIDYVVGIGKDVLASERGKVVKAGFNGSENKKQLGNVIIIDHTPKAGKKKPHLYTIYGHLRSKDIKEGPFAVKVGDKVKQGQVIGYSGNTGKTTGPYLHF